MKYLLAIFFLFVSPLYADYKSMLGPTGINESNFYTKLTDAVRIDDVIVVSFIHEKANHIGLAVSKDAGKNWNFVDSLIGYTSNKGVSFNQLVLQGGRIYALSTAILGKGVVYYSDDKGESWRAIDENKSFFLRGSSKSEKIFSDSKYLYVTYKGCVFINSVCFYKKLVYRIDHGLNGYEVFEAPIEGVRPLSGGGFLSFEFIGPYEFDLVFLDADFKVEKRVNYSDWIYDIVADGNYIAVLGSSSSKGIFIDESFNGGNSFSRSEDFPCRRANINQSFVAEETLFVGSPCGFFYKRIKEKVAFKIVTPLDFFNNDISGYYYDKPRGEVYFTSSLSLRLHTISSGVGKYFYPIPDGAAISDVLEFDGEIYASTNFGSVWKFENDSWNLLSDGLFIQNYDRIPSTIESHIGNLTFRLDTLTFPSVGRVLCAARSYGLYCLNAVSKKWHDVSSSTISSLFGEAQLDYMIAGKLAVLAFLQIDESKVMLSYNHQASGTAQNGDELILSLRDMEANFTKDVPKIVDVAVNSKRGFELSSFQKTTLTKLPSVIIKTEGRATRNLQMFDAVRTGLNQFVIPENMPAGHFYSSPSETLIGKEFLTSDLQAFVKYDKGYVAAVRDAGVYFSESLESGWVPRNKLLPNQYFNSLAVFNSVLYVGTDLGIYQWDPDKGQWGLVEGTATDNVSVLRPYSGGLLVGTTQGVKILQLKAAGRKRNRVLKYAVLSAAQG